MFGSPHLDCLCENNTCSACKWLDEYYEERPELRARRVYVRGGYYVWEVPRDTKTTRKPSADVAFKPFKSIPFEPKFDPSMRAVAAKR